MLRVRSDTDAATGPIRRYGNRPRDFPWIRRGRWRTCAHGRAHGEILPIRVSALSDSPFAHYFVPGAIPFTVLGIGPLGAAVLASRRHPAAPMLTFAVGGALLIWLIVEIVIVGYSNEPPLQAWYLGLGVVISLVGVGWMRRVGWPAVGVRE
jgi:hypothetical protein